MSNTGWQLMHVDVQVVLVWTCRPCRKEERTQDQKRELLAC